MIEDVNKSVRRRQTVDDKYLDALRDEMVSLYRLDQIAAANGDLSFSSLPAASAALLAGLVVCWICLGAYSAVQKIKEKKH